jgi:hypothetical protein
LGQVVTIEPAGDDPMLWYVDDEEQELNVEESLVLAMHLAW